VDFDRGLNTAVNRLRDVLGDSTNHPRFVETAPGGYRLNREITMVIASDSEKHRSRRPPRPWTNIAVLVKDSSGKAWQRNVQVLPDSEVSLRATLKKIRQSEPSGDYVERIRSYVTLASGTFTLPPLRGQ
jgi:hypothetical protein